MDKAIGRLLVHFDNPFWVGIFERVENGKLSVCKVTFGAEPKDYEVLRFISQNYFQLSFSPTVEFVSEIKENINPKRLQREVKKQIQNVGIGTKSQQALKLKQQKRKEKHKGR